MQLNVWQNFLIDLVSKVFVKFREGDVCEEASRYKSLRKYDLAEIRNTGLLCVYIDLFQITI